MEKTYRIVEHTEPMTREEIRQLYDGYWVYVVNAQFSETNGFIRGVPVVIGAHAFDGVRDGIYDKYRDEKYNQQCDLVFTHDKGLVMLLAMEGASA